MMVPERWIDGLWLLLAVAIAGCGGAAGATEVLVQSNAEWQASGVRLEAGQRLVAVATGQYVFHLDGFECGPAGVPEAEAATGSWPESALTGLALIGRIGATGEAFVVGERVERSVQRAGELYMRVNDDIVDENSGTLTVAVEVHAS